MLFDGWMVASSPALNALDHPRYRRLGDPLHDGDNRTPSVVSTVKVSALGFLQASVLKASRAR